MRRALVACAMVTAIADTAHAELRTGPYLQDVTPRGITVMWHSDPPVAGTLVVDGPGLPAQGATIAMPAQRTTRAVVTGLRPASRYRYRVEVAGVRKVGEFATAPEVGANVPFSFIVFGDCGLSRVRQRSVVERASTEVPDFILGTGDLVNDGARVDEWESWFEVYGPLLRDNVMFNALGNHDRQARGQSVENIRRFFTVPDRAAFVTDIAPRYYAFSYGPARFLVLDSNAKGSGWAEHTRWLEAELAAARRDRRVRHVFVVLHHPAYSISIHGGSKKVRDHWVPLFEKYGVAAVFSGHDHVYERAENNGIRYFVAGGGGALPYEAGKRQAAIDRAAVKRFASVNHYVRVTVVGDQIEASAVVVDGTILETLVWGGRKGTITDAIEGPAPADGTIAALTPGPAPLASPRADAELRATPSRGVAMLAVAGTALALLAGFVMVRALRREV